MLPDRESNPGPLTYESGALPIALRGPARFRSMVQFFGSAKIIIFTIFKLVPILWVSQYLSTLRYAYFFRFLRTKIPFDLF